MAMKKLYMLLAAVLLMVITGCGGGGGSTPAVSSAKAITAFNIVTPVAATGVITEATHTIAITVPFGTVVTALVPTITHTGASINPATGVANNFTTQAIYTVTAADATTQNYTVTVTVSPLSGSLDTTFGKSGMVTTSIGSVDGKAHALGIQSDGKIVAAGSSNNGSNDDFTLVRYNTNGNLDTSGTPGIGFGTTGIVTTPIGSGNAVANALGIQSDGKIVAAGYSLLSGTENVFTLVRYNTNGSLDAGFGIGGIVTTPIGSGSVNDQADALGIQSDGKIVVTGYSYNGTKYNFALVRYNTNGSLDAGFGIGGIVTTSIGSGSIIDDKAHALVIQSDGKIVVAGSSYDNTSSKYNFALVRYNTDGSLDTSGTLGIGFGTTGIVTTSIGTVIPTILGSGWDYAYALGIQSDKKILAAGSSNNGSNYDFALVRYNTDGSLDTGFGTGGKVTTPIGSSDDFALALGIQPNGRIVAAGYSLIGSENDFALVRYLP
jgi:uncharacterized delta-60 repeat protein